MDVLTAEPKYGRVTKHIAWRDPIVVPELGLVLDSKHAYRVYVLPALS